MKRLNIYEPPVVKNFTTKQTHKKQRNFSLLFFLFTLKILLTIIALVLHATLKNKRKTSTTDDMMQELYEQDPSLLETNPKKHTF